MILFDRLITRRTAQWALYPDAARGYLAGEQDPDGELNDGLAQINGDPGNCWIEIRHQVSRILIDRVWSADGTWQVLDLPANELYEVQATDPTDALQPVVRRNVAPYT